MTRFIRFSTWIPALLCGLGAATGSLAAQSQSAITWGPELAPLGCPVHYSFTNGGPGDTLWDPCGFRVFDAAGNLVASPPCGGPVQLGPGEFHTSTWDQLDDRGDPVPPGSYFLNDPAGLEVQVGAAEASVAPLGTRTLELCSPLDPNLPYVLAASFTNNTGITICGITIPLDPDPIFRLSRRRMGFQGFTGVLDSDGRALARLVLPPDVGLFSLVFAFVVVDSTSPCGIRRVSAPTRTLIQ